MAARGDEGSVVSILPLLRKSDWRRPEPLQLRTLSKVFAVMRGMAGLLVLALSAILYRSNLPLALALLILFVTTYDLVAMAAFYRVSDRGVLQVARAVAVVDVVSYFWMLWVFGPTPPGALIACYIGLLNVSVTIDGIIGAAMSTGLFIIGYAFFQAARSYLYGLSFASSDLVLWGVVMIVMAVSLTSFQSVLVSTRAPIMGDGAAPALRLSAREREVLQLVAEGYSNTMIANRLHLSENTVKGYVESLLTHLHARNRAEAVAAASRLNLI
jgi:DNA-binding CsgD family transcriptional regulator